MAPSDMVLPWADRGEGGDEVVEGSRARVADGDGDKFQPPPDLLEGRDEGGVFFAELYKMAFTVPCSTVGNGLWEMGEREMGFA